MRRKSWKKLSEADFKLVKTLLAAGVKKNKIGEIANRSQQVISDIEKVGNLAEYRQTTTERNKGREKTSEQREEGRNLIEYRLTQIKVLLEKIAGLLDK